MKKKLCLIFAMLCSPLLIAAQSSTSYVTIAQEKAMKQFNESFDRFKRCVQGKCTKMEALKAARDLGIAATAAITGLYITGGVFKKGSHYIYRAGKHMQRPGKFVYEKASRLVYPFQKDDRVKYKDETWYVDSSENNNVRIWQHNTKYSGNKFFQTVPAADLTLIPWK